MCFVMGLTAKYIRLTKIWFGRIVKDKRGKKIKYKHVYIYYYSCAATGGRTYLLPHNG